MFKKYTTKIKSFFNLFKLAQHQFRKQSAYEVGDVSVCQKTGQHIIEIKITGKDKSISCLAEEIVVDNSFIMGFTPCDVRTITHLATCDRYEKILHEEKIKKCYELVRSKSRSGNKKIQLRHKETNEHMVVSLSDFSDHTLIDKLVSQDAYYLGYLAGQEQILKDCIRLKLISRCEETE